MSVVSSELSVRTRAAISQTTGSKLKKKETKYNWIGKKETKYNWIGKNYQIITH